MVGEFPAQRASNTENVSIWWRHDELQEFVTIENVISTRNTADRKSSNIDFSARVTLRFDRWLRKTIGNLFRAPRRYVCHVIAIYEFKLELSSGIA